LHIEGDIGPAPELRYVPRSAAASQGVSELRSLGQPWASKARFALGRTRLGHIPHWDVPPCFPDARKALEELGVEPYKQAVADYYKAIQEFGVDREQHAHKSWAVRKVVSAFETHVRGYRGGRFIAHGPDLVAPSELMRDGLLMKDLDYIIKRYQVREDLRPLAVRMVRMRLRKIWGVR